MQRLSSKSTVISKKVFPILWFGFLAVFLGTALFGIPRQIEAIPFLIAPLIMGVVGYVVMRKMLFNLVDEVWDAGDFLVVRNRGEETTIRLEEIVNVSYTTFSNPSRAILRLRQAGRFGQEIPFIPVNKGWAFSKNAMIDQLIDRIDAARRRRG